MKPGILRSVVVIATMTVLSGCYGTQLVKGPIYTEQVLENTDSALVEQEQTQRHGYHEFNHAETVLSRQNFRIYFL